MATKANKLSFYYLNHSHKSCQRGSSCFFSFPFGVLEKTIGTTFTRNLQSLEFLLPCILFSLNMLWEEPAGLPWCKIYQLESLCRNFLKDFIICKPTEESFKAIQRRDPPDTLFLAHSWWLGCMTASGHLCAIPLPTLSAPAKVWGLDMVLCSQWVHASLTA